MLAQCACGVIATTPAFAATTTDLTPEIQQASRLVDTASQPLEFRDETGQKTQFMGALTAMLRSGAVEIIEPGKNSSLRLSNVQMTSSGQVTYDLERRSAKGDSLGYTTVSLDPAQPPAAALLNVADAQRVLADSPVSSSDIVGFHCDLQKDILTGREYMGTGISFGPSGDLTFVVILLPLFFLVLTKSPKFGKTGWIGLGVVSVLFLGLGLLGSATNPGCSK